MPAIHEPMCRVGGAAIEVHRHRRPLFTYIKDIFCVMEKPILNENKNISSRDNTPSGSTTASPPASVNSKVYPKPKFLKLLQSVGAKGKSFQISEIITYLKEYISSKQLFDKQKPWLVHCENDYLGSVFHCKQFTIDDVRGLLNQNVTVCKSDDIDNNEDESFDSDATEILVSSMSDSDHEPPQKTTPLDDIISSSTSESPKPIFSSTDPLLRVKPAFLEILQDAGAKGEVFREKEIFRHLKNYVWSRRLFDPLHPWICLCQNDKLSNVFKCDKFLIRDVPHLVAKFGVIYPEYRPKVIRSNTDLPPKIASAVMLPLRSHMSSPGRQQSTPSDITSSTADVIAPTFAYHIDGRTFNKSEQWGSAVPNRSEQCGSAMPNRSEQCGSAVPNNRSEQCGSAVPNNRSEQCGSAVPNNRLEQCGSAVPNRSEQCGSAMPNRSEESGSAIPSRSEESESATPSKSEESGSAVPNRYKESSPATSSKSEKSGPCISVESGPSTPSRSGERVPATLSSSQESRSVVPSLSQESELSASCSRPTQSFTLTLEMQDDNEVLSFQSEEPVDDVYVEYEVMSNSSSFHMSDSEVEHHKVSMDMLVICQDSDIECYADYSDTGSDTDVELSEADKWCCSNCQLYNSPIHRLCDRCWTLRPDWLPDRLPDRDKQSSPKPDDKNVEKQVSKKLQNKTKSSLDMLRSKGNGANSSGEVSSDDDSLHSDNPNRMSRPPTPSADDYDPCLVNSSDLKQTEVISCNDTLDSRTTLSNICHINESEVPARRTRNQTRKRTLISESDDSDYCSKFPKMSSPVKSLVAPGLCIICSHNPRDASLIHGASGHQICCLTCAKKLKQKGSKCPICRRTIQKVVRNYLT